MTPRSRTTLPGSGYAAGTAKCAELLAERRYFGRLLQGDADRLVDPAAARELAARLTCPTSCSCSPVTITSS
jgi:hypothetical protein